MATDFKYAAQTDLEMYYPNFSSYDSKRQVYGWTSLGSGIYVSYNTGLVSQLYIDGQEGNAAQAQESGTSTWTTATSAASMVASPTSGTSSYNTITTTGSMSGGSESDIEVGSYCTIGSVNPEKCYIQAVDTSANTITVLRGALGSTANIAAWSGGSTVAEYLEVNTINNWFYDSYLDHILMYSASDPNDLLIEGGIDNATYFDQMLVNASMELNNLLDGRYATPLPKVAQIDQNTASNTQAKEYDAIVIKMTSYICVANILRAEGQTEEADYYYSQVTNADRTGIVDRLNAGEFKLSYEVDAKDRQGAINNKSVSGSMDIVETDGQYVGEAYDLLKITCTTTGAYGVAEVKVEYYGNDKIFGQESDPELVTGGLQELNGLGGLMVRFQGASMTQNDYWEIEVASASREITNAQSSAIDLTRRGYSY